jgi:Mlc titration factor MtfA (ptsG expression regulator)
MEDLIRLFDDAVDWEDLDSGSVDPVTRLDIAARACLMVAARSLDLYRDVTSVLVSHGTVSRRAIRTVGGGILADGSVCLSGEARLHGPVMVVWPQVPAVGRDVVIHEVAHKLDMADGFSDGLIPGVGPGFEAALGETHRALLEGSDSGYLDPYAGFSVVELLAVASEAFFIDPVGLGSSEPQLYEALVSAYALDPKRWYR